MWRRIWSLRRWAYVFRKLPGLLSSSQVPWLDKLLLLLPAVTYWIIPDVLPFLPIDDLAVTLLLMDLFVERAERHHSGRGDYRS